MTEFIKQPHLPQNRVTLAAMAQGNEELQQALEKQNVQVLTVQKHPILPRAISCHSDLLLHPLGGNKIVAAAYADSPAGELRQHGFEVHTAQKLLGSCYSDDIPLNAFKMKGYCLGKQDSLDQTLVGYYEKEGISFLDIKQGYAKCSVTMVSEHAAITADKGIGAALQQIGVDVLFIREGHILLPGYTYGFIGGCSGLLAPDLLGFTGNVLTHPDGDKITAFAKQHHVSVLSLGIQPLLDIGGIMPLKEEASI